MIIFLFDNADTYYTIETTTDNPERKKMYSVTLQEWFHGPGTGYEYRHATHTRSVKRAMELAKKSKPVESGCTASCPVLMEITIKRNNKIIFHKFS